MGVQKAYNKMKKKMVLAGSRMPRTDLRRLAAFNGFNNAANVRRYSVEVARRELNGLEKKFPRLSEGIRKKPEHEWARLLETIDYLTPPIAEKALARGVALKDLRYYSRDNALGKFSPNQKEREIVFARFGYKPQSAQLAAELMKHFPTQEINHALIELAKLGYKISGSNTPNKIALNIGELPLLVRAFKHNPKETAAFLNLKKLDTEFAGHDLTTQLVMFLKLSEEMGGADKAAELVRGKKLRLRKDRKNVVVLKKFYDYRRHGKPFFAFSSEQNPVLGASLAKRGVHLFPCTIKARNVGSSSIYINNRKVFYMEVPEFKELFKYKQIGVKGKRIQRMQHVTGALSFADVALLPAGEKEKVAYIQELQTDVLRFLPEEVRKKYGSWEKLLILSVAKWADREGIKTIDMSTPQLISEVWTDEISRSVLQRIYFDVPHEMGFVLINPKQNVRAFDSAFGKVLMGESDSLWRIKTAQIKKDYPEFFE